MSLIVVASQALFCRSGLQSFNPKLTDSSFSVPASIETDAAPFNDVEVLQKTFDWCVLKPPKGMGANELIDWVCHNETRCFEFMQTLYSPGSRYDCIEEPPIKRGRTFNFDPALANPLCGSNIQSIVLVVRERSILETIAELRVTNHCVIAGHHTPSARIELKSFVASRVCVTKATCLDTAPSERFGAVSLLVTHNCPEKSPWVAPKQFRRHLGAGGWPVLRKSSRGTETSGTFLMAAIKLEFQMHGMKHKEDISLPPPIELRALLEQEERSWRIKRGQESLRSELFRAGTPRPQEYIEERVVFDDLELRVTPAVMIPRSSSSLVVERATSLFEQRTACHGAVSPLILDAGTGCGNLLLSMIQRLKYCNARGAGIDCFREALSIADYNIAALGMSDFAETIQGAFQDLRFLEHQPFTIIVCNPPHHTDSDRYHLHPSTLEYEPQKALFVDEQDPLKYYRQVLRGLIEGKLVVGGAILVFETSAILSEQVAQLLLEASCSAVNISSCSSSSTRTVEGILL